MRLEDWVDAREVRNHRECERIEQHVVSHRALAAQQVLDRREDMEHDAVERDEVFVADILLEHRVPEREQPQRRLVLDEVMRDAVAELIAREELSGREQLVDGFVELLELGREQVEEHFLAGLVIGIDGLARERDVFRDAAERHVFEAAFVEEAFGRCEDFPSPVLNLFFFSCALKCHRSGLVSRSRRNVPPSGALGIDFLNVGQRISLS